MSGMGTIPNDIRRLLDDCELFVSDILQNEKLSENTEETRQVLLNNFRVVHVRNPQEFPLRLSADLREEDGSDDNRSSSLGRSAPSDDASLASDYQDDGAPELFEDIPFTAAQDLNNVLKQGYLEKRRRDPSFFGPGWQRRWCVLNNSIFFYFGSDKDKQQKGSFYINGYSVQLVANVRKDSKKNACFELFAPGRRTFQFTASSPEEAREWVNHISFVLRDLSSSTIPFDEDEEDDESGDEEGTYDDIDDVSHSAPPWPAAPNVGRWQGEDEDEDDEGYIYEVLPDEDFPDPPDECLETANKTEFANYYQAVWHCQADQPDELSFARGDLIFILSKGAYISWWRTSASHASAGASFSSQAMGVKCHLGAG
ncbi:src kinase-associated phosphoprotein 1 isoform X1 [Entelurus aequoreus]|uniref:src kinase-associated phosphoprotein 1 isoform X1 n=1 Tax=Entelurus aequoreus TaxID=161455 RepID=UPI002B1DF8B1|nr:src kinase-associated phosphoprotein 1 isoform X1 [Entelurus aequoreus]XP_061912860.1 src kinase-associated phosphoprotein 1 isoform X1 [Entelurus aequoreus]XP_061912861.1 src kinase-associated phosphoprotein 1 isoform X1 [Entelurus aequoreus]XP_061912862.1 src kinase-associated phosphoprotein 1 isoform X1 [Entelurus aequoreus]